jgi:hypothetical protein
VLEHARCRLKLITDARHSLESARIEGTEQYPNPDFFAPDSGVRNPDLSPYRVFRV